VYTATANPTQDVINIGTATGYDSSGTPREASDEAWVDVINPGISTEKSTNGFDADNVPGPSILIGEQITWIYEITNTGDVVLSDVVVSDSIAGVNPVFVGGGDTNGNNRLDTYETWTYEATGIAVVGQYENNGNVTAKDPLEGDVTDDDLSHYFGMNPALTIEKVADKATVSVAGTVINYTITVDNTGNVDLTNVVLTDVFAGGAMLDSGDTNSNDILETTETWIYTASYTVTQSDINEGEDLVNVANVDTDQTDEQQDDATTEVSQNPSISIIKTGTLNDDDGTPGVSVGDTISYSFIVENTGNVTLDNVVLSETVGGVTISALSDIADDGVGVLARGGSEAATGTYTITQTDIDAGQFYNEAKVDATDPNDQLVTDTDDETVDLEQGPAYTIVKTATGIDTAGDGSINNAGEIIDYTIVVENTGNVSLHNVNVADPLLGTLGGPTESGIGDGILAVDETFTYTGSYTVQQSDLDDNGISSNGDADGDGDIDNEATVSSEELQDKTASAEVPIIRSPAISVVKTADPTSVSVAGTTVTYSYTVENAGNVTLNNVTLADDNGTSGDTSDDFSVSLNSTTLAPGETATGISTRVITQEDMDIGSDIINLATAESDKAGPVDDNAKVSMSQEPSILLVKAGTLNDDDGTAGVSAGDTIDYSFTVTNTGNVTLTNVTVTDPDVTVNGGPISLAPGASDTDTFTGTYTITQADIDAGVKDNTATVTGKDPEGQDVTDTDDESVTLPQSPAIDIEKSTNGQDADNPPGPNVVVGDAITWSYVVTNVGNVTLTNIEVTDSDLGSVATIASLAPGGSQALTASGTAVGGQYENTGTATVLFDETTYSDSDDSHYFGSGADLSLTKVVDDARPNEGDTVIYTITLTNDGPNDATGVEVTDVLPDGLSYVSDNGGGAYSSTTNVWTVGGLANGGSVTLAITVTVDAGTGGTTITNTAEVTAADQPDPDSTPNNQDPTEDDQVSVDLTVQSADLVVEKTVDNPTPNEGDTIVYTITITNDGPSDATGVTLDDLLPVGVTYVSDNSAGAYSPFTGVWTIGDLAFEETRTLAITATVHTGTAGTTITNAAEITTSDQPDPDLTNNRDTADMTIAEGGGGGGGSSDPCEGKVIINEVAWSGTIEDSRDEWIELRNLGTIPVDLTGWTIQWRRKNPTTEEEKRWKVVDLSGVILPAGTSACDLVDDPQTVSVTLEKTEIDAVSWRVITEKQQHDESFYILERRHDETISNSQADLIYDISQPYRIELDDAGDVIQLVDNLGEVVDTANAFPFPSDGWPGGDAATHATMERTDPLAADTADNWHTNLGIVIWGEDAARNALIATADAPNSSKLDQLWLDPDAPVAKTRAGARLEVGLEVTKQERRAYGWPWVRVTQPQLVASAGGGGAVEQGAGFTFSGRYSNDVYWLGIDTAKLLPGRYNVWIVYGGGKTVLVPIEILL
jgi:uncharacterized repeat protein (TIGR01451 family)